MFQKDRAGNLRSKLIELASEYNIKQQDIAKIVDDAMEEFNQMTIVRNVEKMCGSRSRTNSDVSVWNFRNRRKVLENARGRFRAEHFKQNAVKRCALPEYGMDGKPQWVPDKCCN